MSLRHQFIQDILVQVPQAIAYWATHIKQHDVIAGHTRWIIMAEDENQERVVDGKVIERGLYRVSSARLSRDVKNEIREADSESDSTQIDSECVDIIVQLGLYNDLVFG